MYNIVHSPLNDSDVQDERMITIQNLKAKIDGLKDNCPNVTRIRKVNWV